jgi:DNA topoisomerase IA
MVSKILCVAEKPAIAKSVANHLAGGNVNVVRLLVLLREGWRHAYVQCRET